MTTYRVTADLSGNTDDKFKADIEADNEDQAWAIAYKSQLPRGIYNGKVEELPTRAELIAAHAALVEACKPIAKAVKENAPADDEVLDEEQFLYDVFQSLTADELLNLAALLDGKG